jgi:hypothetical protein
MTWRYALIGIIAVVTACGVDDPTAPAGEDTDTTDTDTTDTDTTDTDTTDTDTTDTDTTDTDTTDTDTTEPDAEVVLAAPDPSLTPAVLTGVVARCEGATQALVIGEFVGGIGTVTATPIVEGVLLDAVSLPVEERSLFHRGEALVEVVDCETTAWRIVAAASGVETCMVTGPGAEAWLASSGSDCDLR